MKASLSLALRFLLTTLFLSVVLTLCREVYELILFRPPEVAGIARSLGMMFPLALFMGILFTFFFLPGRPDRSAGTAPWFLSWILLFALAFLIFLFGFSGISRISEKTGTVSWPDTEDMSSRSGNPVFLVDWVDRRAYGKVFVPGERGEIVEGPEQVVVLNGRDRGPQREQNFPKTWFSKDPEIQTDVDGFLLLGDDREERLFLRSGRADMRRLYTFPSSVKGLKGLGADFLLFLRDLSSVEESGFGHYLLLVFLITFFFLSLSLFARITIWPLANIVFLLIMFRVFFLLYRIFSSSLVNDLLPLEGFPPSVRGVELLLFTTAFVLLLLDILFVGDRVLGKAK